MDAAKTKSERNLGSSGAGVCNHSDFSYNGSHLMIGYSIASSPLSSSRRLCALNGPRNSRSRNMGDSSEL